MKIEKEFLQFKHVIMTSRLNTVPSDLKDVFDRLIEIEGLNDDSIAKYVANYFSSLDD